MKHLLLITLLLLLSASTAAADVTGNWSGIQAMTPDHNAVACLALGVTGQRPTGDSEHPENGVSVQYLWTDYRWIWQYPPSLARRIYSWVAIPGGEGRVKMADYTVSTVSVGNRYHTFNYTSMNGLRSKCVLDRVTWTATWSGAF